MERQRLRGTWVVPLIAWLIIAAGAPQIEAPGPQSPDPARADLLAKIAATHHVSAAGSAAMSRIFASSPWMGQGNPQVSTHPATPDQCRARLKENNVDYADKANEEICGAPYMAPLYDPQSGESAKDARVCIDRLEFPNIPCEYPVVWTRADEAADICETMGKRLCDAHEWEGACEGRLTPPDYEFGTVKNPENLSAAAGKLRSSHNARASKSRRWAYGLAERRGVCAMASFKSDGCNGGDWKRCGSNTYPAGMFSECTSPLGVLDQHGNAAEHMNLPLTKEQLASTPGSPLGVTEMKGSWFIWDRFQAHEDWCRWRAPFWHGTKVRDPKSHHNYHLGFRCCKTIVPAPRG